MNKLITLQSTSPL